MTTQLGKLGVEVKLDEECTVNTIEQSRPDAVIVATRAMPIIPDIPGIERANCRDGNGSPNRDKGVGPNVVIVGGGSIGCETAEFLYQKGKRVILLEVLDRIGADIGEMNRSVVIRSVERVRDPGGDECNGGGHHAKRGQGHPSEWSGGVF